jgi:hypothetical protein
LRMTRVTLCQQLKPHAPSSADIGATIRRCPAVRVSPWFGRRHTGGGGGGAMASASSWRCRLSWGAGTRHHRPIDRLGTPNLLRSVVGRGHVLLLTNLDTCTPNWFETY